MRVLSLFDGMSCGRIALDRAGISVTEYYASEIDKYAIKVSEANYPDITRLGDVKTVKGEDLPQIDLLLAGSPCQGFSFAGKQLAFDDPRSALFFEFVRILKETKPKYFLLENVKMKKEFQDVISEAVGVEPIEINSALVSAQNRKRLYWTNIPNVTQPEDKAIYLSDILDRDSDYTYMSSKFIERFLRYGIDFTLDLETKAKCLTAMEYVKNGKQGNYIIQINPCRKAAGKQPRMQDRIYFTEGCKSPALTSFCNRLNITDLSSFTVRKLTPIECERLQTIPENFTAHVSNTQRYRMLGNGWTVDVIAHILRGIPKLDTFI